MYLPCLACSRTFSLRSRCRSALKCTRPRRAQPPGGTHEFCGPKTRTRARAEISLQARRSTQDSLCESQETRVEGAPRRPMKSIATLLQNALSERWTLHPAPPLSMSLLYANGTRALRHLGQDRRVPKRTLYTISAKARAVYVPSDLRVALLSMSHGQVVLIFLR